MIGSNPNPDITEGKTYLIYTAKRDGKDITVGLFYHEDDRISFVMEDENGKPFTSGVLYLPHLDVAKKEVADSLYRFLTEGE